MYMYVLSKDIKSLRREQSHHPVAVTVLAMAQGCRGVSPAPHCRLGPKAGFGGGDLDGIAESCCHAVFGDSVMTYRC